MTDETTPEAPPTPQLSLEALFFEAIADFEHDVQLHPERFRTQAPGAPPTAIEATPPVESDAPPVMALDTLPEKPLPSLDIDRSPTSRRVLPPKVYADRKAPIHIKEIKPEQITEFLMVLAETGLWELSAQRNGLSARIIRKLKAVDDDFRSMCDEAMSLYVDGVVKELHRRAVEGWNEPVFSHKSGSQIGTIRRYDSKLLELLVKRHAPEFREKFEGEVKVTGGVIVVPAPAMDPDAWVKAAQQPRQVASTVVESQPLAG